MFPMGNELYVPYDTIKTNKFIMHHSVIAIHIFSLIGIAFLYNVNDFDINWTVKE